MCFRMRGVILCKSHVVERAQDAGRGFNTIGKHYGGEARKMRYIYSSSCNFWDQLVLLVNEDKTAQPSSCRTTRHHMNEEPRSGI